MARPKDPVLAYLESLYDDAGDLLAELDAKRASAHAIRSASHNLEEIYAVLEAYKASGNVRAVRKFMNTCEREWCGTIRHWKSVRALADALIEEYSDLLDELKEARKNLGPRAHK